VLKPDRPKVHLRFGPLRRIFYWENLCLQKSHVAMSLSSAPVAVKLSSARCGVSVFARLAAVSAPGCMTVRPPAKTHQRPLFQKSGTTPPKLVSDFNKLPDPKNRSLRATLRRNAIQSEYFGGGKWREVISPDGVRCYVTQLWGKDNQLEQYE
jgi:hypothetical protein